MARNNLVRNYESYAVSIAVFLNELVLREFVGPRAAAGVPIDLETRPEQLEELDTLLKDHIRHFPIEKIKIYGPEGRILFSTDRSLIGYTNPENRKFRQAVEGKTVSFLLLAEMGADTKLEEARKDLLEVYVPVKAPGGAVTGVFEIYLDVTLLYGEISRTRERVALHTVGVLGLLFLALIVIVYNGQRVIRRSERNLLATLRELSASEGRILRKTLFLEILNEVARTSYATDLEAEPFSHSLSRVREFCGLDAAWLCIYRDPGDAPLLLVADRSSGLNPEALSDLFLRREGDPVAARLWHGSRVVSEELSSLEGGAEWSRACGLRAAALLPLGTVPGACGYFGGGTREPREIPGETLEALSAVVSQFTLSVRNVKLFRDVNDLSLTDQLTGVANRRGMTMVLEREIAVSSRYHRALSVIMADIDHFKRVNDTFGHAVGDTVLRRVAECIRANIRGTDFVSRYGGEEFCVILPYTDGEMSLVIGERLRRAVADLRFARGGGDGFRVTASFGIATFRQDAATGEELLRRADEALYRAKTLGRDRVEPYRRDVDTVG